MWEFLAEVLRTQGLVALVLVGAIGGQAWALFHLWDQNQRAAKGYSESLTTHAASLTATLASHQKELVSLTMAHAKEMNDVRDQLRAETRFFAEQLDKLHEKRAQEMSGMVREAVQHITSTRAAVDKITDAMSALRDLIRRDQ